MKKLAVIIINFYQKYLSFDRGLLMVLAPGGACLFEVSCSEFTKQAILEKGLLKGGFLGFKRILSCNKWN